MNKAGRKIRVKEVVADIRAGVRDPDLMEKYQLTTKQLEVLFQQLLNKGFVSQEELDARLSLSETAITKAFVDVQQSIQELDDDTPTVVEELPPPPRKGKLRVKAKSLVRDIRAALTDDEIMEKYGMSERQLEFILTQLVDKGHLTPEEIYNRASLSHSSISKAFQDVYRFLKELD